MLEILERTENELMSSIEIKRSKSDCDQKFDCNAESLMMLEGMSLQVTLGGQSGKDAPLPSNDPS